MTKSLAQSLTPMFFSIVAFVLGMVTIAASDWSPVERCVVIILNTQPPIDIIHSPDSYKYATSVVWYVSQTMAECLISCKPHFLFLVKWAPRLTFVVILVRALLKARSGMKRSNSVVRYLVRNIIQTAALATIWSIAALVSWFWLERIVLYTIFDKTSGTVYTHVSVFSFVAGLSSSEGECSGDI